MIAIDYVCVLRDEDCAVGVDEQIHVCEEGQVLSDNVYVFEGFICVGGGTVIDEQSLWLV